MRFWDFICKVNIKLNERLFFSYYTSDKSLSTCICLLNNKNKEDWLTILNAPIERNDVVTITNLWETARKIIGLNAVEAEMLFSCFTNYNLQKLTIEYLRQSRIDARHTSISLITNKCCEIKTNQKRSVNLKDFYNFSKQLDIFQIQIIQMKTRERHQEELTSQKNQYLGEELK